MFFRIIIMLFRILEFKGFFKIIKKTYVMKKDNSLNWPKTQTFHNLTVVIVDIRTFF